MPAVSVLALDIVRDDHKRLEAADGLAHALLQFLKIIMLLRALEGRGIFVRKIQIDRVVADAARPQTVEFLVLAHRLRAPELAHIRDLYTALLLPAVLRQHAAHKEHFIVRVRRQHKDIRRLERRLPHLHIRGQPALGICVDLAHIDRILDVDRHLGRRFRKRDIVVQIAVLPVLLRAVVVCQCVRNHRRAPADIQAVHRLLRGDLEGFALLKLYSRFVGGIAQLALRAALGIFHGDLDRSRILLRLLGFAGVVAVVHVARRRSGNRHAGRVPSSGQNDQKRKDNRKCHTHRRAAKRPQPLPNPADPLSEECPHSELSPPHTAGPCPAVLSPTPTRSADPQASRPSRDKSPPPR